RTCGPRRRRGRRCSCRASSTGPSASGACPRECGSTWARGTDAWAATASPCRPPRVRRNTPDTDRAQRAGAKARALTMSANRWVTAVLVPLLASGCKGEGVTEPDPGGEDPDALPVLGHGPVTERYTAEVAARDGWAYTTTWGSRGGVVGNAVKIWDVSGDAPVLVDSLIIEGATTTGDVQISDDGTLLVVATELAPGSIVVFDRSDPARPRQLSRFQVPSTQNGVHTVKLGRVDGRLYAFLAVNPSPAQLVVVDLTEPTTPQEVLVRPMGNPVVHDVFVRDGLLFTALWHDGLTIWGIGAPYGGSPSDPLPLGNVRTVGGSVHNVWWFHDGASR